MASHAAPILVGDRAFSARAKALLRRRRDVAAELAAVDAEIAGLGVKVKSKSINEHSLTEVLHRLLSGRTMSATDAARTLLEQGFLTTSPQFPRLVFNALRHPRKFRRVGRGLYTAT